MCGAAAINVPAILLPFYCAAFLNRLAGNVADAWARETVITLFEHARQVVGNDSEGKRRVWPFASFDSIGHAQMASLQEEQECCIIHFSTFYCRARIRRTEVRPIFRRWAIFDLLMSARYSFPISVV